MKIEEIIRVNAKGFGFIDTDNESYFVPAAFINGAMDGDLVLVEVKDDKYSDDKKVARVKRIVKRNTVKVVAEITMAKGKVKIIPDDKRITKTLKIASGVTVKTGEKVILELKDHTRDYIWCEVVEVIGHKDDPGTDILSIVHTHGIPTEFDIDVLKQAKNISQEVLPKEYDGRKDLRDKVVITIDGETAKDLDDAICVERLDNGNYFLGVYIADVSHYVKENSLIDLSAYERGTSVYLADRVIPMLPRDLSNGICSLNGNVDRLVIGCEMEITPKGNVVNREIIEGVINTKHRMTYTDVNKILKNNKETTDKYGDIVDMVFASFDLSHAIRHAKVERGMIDFDLPEPEIIVDKTGKAIDVIKKDRGESERIIEDFMVIANETVARLFDDNELTGIYRIHELPEEKKLAQFYTFLKTIGISVTAKYEDVQPKDIQTILNQIHDRVEFPVIASMLLRSMQKAIYSKECLGHFGIGASHYTHFTSPIRRYPDLIVHRLLREYFINGDTSKKTVRS